MLKGFLLFVVACSLLVQIHAINRAGFNYGFALEFDGSKEYVDLPNLELLGGAMTFEAWIYPVGSGVVFEFGSGYRSDSFRLRWSGGACTFEMWYKNSNYHSLVSAPVPANTWSMVTVVLKADNRAFIYVNGQNVRSTNPIWFLPRCLRRPSNFIGRSSFGEYFLGVIDEVVIWGVPLAQNQITTRKILTGNDTGLLYYWNFDQGIGGIAEDLGPTKSNGALGGGNLYNYPFWVVPYSIRSQTCTSCGDPHITTFDGVYWHYQGGGEFWLLKSDDGDIQVQVRQDQWVGNPGASVNIGIALRAYGDTVSIDVDFRRHPGKIFLRTNGQLRTESQIYMPNSGIIINYVHQSSYVYWEIDVPFLYAIKMISYFSQHSNIWLRIYEDRFGTPMGGECGTWDGNSNNDFRNPNTGVVYPLSQYFNFGNSLRVPWAQSFFNEENVYVEVVPKLEIEFLDPVLEAKANAICKNRQIVAADFEFGCLFDIAVTGEIHLAFPAAQATYELCLERAATVPGSPQCTIPCPNFCSLQGKCGSNGVCTCNPGFTGRDCSVQKQYWCTKATYDLDSLNPKTISFNPVRSKNNVANYYKYNMRYAASAFTGFEVSNATIMFLQNYRPNVDSPISQTSFIFLNDRYEDGSGGTMSAKFAVTNSNGAPIPVSLQVKDDPGDEYQWVDANGGGTATWRWWECCTDGLALGFLPETTPWNLRVDIDFTQVSGIDQLFIGSQADSGALDIFKVEVEKAQAGIIFSGGWCYDTCGDYDNCSSCLDQVNCGWCDDVGVCTSGGPQGPARSRCRKWRWTKDPSISRQIGFEVGYPVDPSSLSFFLAPNDPIDAHVYVNMPEYEVMPVDTLILQDLSYSNFNPYLNFLESIYRTVYLNTRDIYPLARFALSTFSDKPILPYGSPTAGDHVYQPRVTMTSNSQKFQAGIVALKIADGQDSPMAQLEALLQISKREKEVGFASTAKKIVVVVTKSTFHTPTGQFPANNLDNKIDREDYPPAEAVRTSLLDANMVPVFVVPSNVAAVYRDLVNTWGFGYVSVMSVGVENLGQQIMEGINFVCTSPYLTPNLRGFIQTTSPQIYRGISPGIRVNFDVTLLDNGNITQSTIVSPGYGPLTITATRDDLPKSTADLRYSLFEDSLVVARLDGTNVYGDALEAVITTLPTRGKIYQYSGGAPGDQITAPGTALTDTLKRVFFVPLPDENGLPYDQLTFRLRDSCEACSVKYNVTFYVIPVNDPPVATADSPVSTPEDVPLLLVLGGTDADNDPLTSYINLPQDGLGELYQYVSSGGGRKRYGKRLGPNVGELMSGSQPAAITDPQFRVWFIPRPNLNGKTTFSYFVSDAQSTSNVVNIVVMVDPVNDPPTAISFNVTTREDAAVALTFSGTDPDVGDVLSTQIRVLPTKGRLYQWGPDNTTLGSPINSQGETITDSLGRAWYMPNLNLHSINGAIFEEVSFTLVDSGIPQLEGTGIVTIYVQPINDPPIANPGSSTGNEDTVQITTLTGFDPDTAVDGDVLYAYVCDLPVGGQLLQFDGTPITEADRNANGTIRVTDPQNKVRYLPNLNQHCGVCSTPYDQFSFQMTDRLPEDANRLLSPCANVSLYVLPVNDPPVSSAITPVTGLEDNDTVILLQCQDVDIEANTFRITTTVTRGTLYQAHKVGPSTWARDPSNTVIGDNGVVAGTAWDGNTLHLGYVVFRAPLNANGFPYDLFTFHCEDASTSSSALTVDINVQAVNDPPVANDIANITINEDGQATIYINGTDVDSATVWPEIVYYPSGQNIGTLHQVNPDGSLGAPITFSNNQPTQVTNPNYLVKFVPAPNRNDVTNGSPFVTILYGVNDGNLSSAAKPVSIFVTPVNDPPVATAFPLVGGDEDTDIILTLSGQDIDNSQEELTAHVDVPPTRGQLFQLEINGERGPEITGPVAVTHPLKRVIYRAPLNQHSPTGLDPYVTLTYHITDLEPLSSQPKTFGVVVFAVNDPPAAISQDPVVGFEDGHIVIQLDAIDVDNAAAELTFRALPAEKGTLHQYDPSVSPPVGAEIDTQTVVSTQNKVVFVPFPVTYSCFNTSVLISYTTLSFLVVDPAGLSSSGQIVTYIIHVDHPPVATTENFTVTEDSPATPQRLEGVDVDDIDTVLYSELVVLPTKGQMLSVTGAPLAIGEQFLQDCQFLPTPLRHGFDSLVYRVWDGKLYSENKNVTIFIVHVNHRPVASMAAHVTGQENSDIGPFELQGSDVDGDTPLVATVRTEPTRGVLFQVNTDGSKGAAILSFPTAVTHPNRLVYYRQKEDNTHGPNYDTFTYTINDSQNTEVSESLPATVIMDLTPLNRPPTASATTPAVGWEDIALMIPLFGTTGDEGVFNQTIVAIITTFPTVGTLLQTTDNETVGAGGVLDDFSVWYLPPLNAHSLNDSNEVYQPLTRFGFIVRDDLGAISTEFFVDIIIQSINDFPIPIYPTSLSTEEDTPLAFTLDSTDVEDHPRWFKVRSLPSASLAVFTFNDTQLSIGDTLPSPCQITFTPGTNLNGDPFASFGFTVTDLPYPTALEVEYTVQFSVIPVNDPPSLVLNNPIPYATPGPSGFDEILYTIIEDSNGLQGVLLVNLSAIDVDADQNDLTFTISGSKASVTQIYIPFPGTNGLDERRGFSITYVGTLEQLNAGLANIQLERFDGNLGDELLILNISDNGHTGLGGPKFYNKTYFLNEQFIDNTAGGNPGVITGAAVGGGVAAIAAVFGAYKLLKKKNLIDSADPWESEDAFQSTIDNPLYNYDQNNANVLYEPPPSGTA